MRSFRPVWASALLLILACCLAWAQFNSSVQGIVQDSSGAVVTSATVKLRNIATNVVDETKSSSEGFYRFNSIAVGRYEVTVEASGFQSKTVEVNITTGQSRDVNVTMVVATTQESVQVTAEAPPIDTTETRVQMSLVQEKLRDLPMFGNNLINIIATAPGVVGIGSPGADNFDPEYWPDMSANGRNFAGNQFNMDGLSVTSNITNGTLNVAPNPDAIQELTVETNTFKVDQGLSSSLVVNMVTKSGSNQFHGSGTYLFTNQDLRARTVFTDQYEPFKRHNLSGAFGGPVIKNKTFFFAAVETLRSQASSSTSVTTFESPEFVSWAQQHFPNSLGTQILTDYPVVGAGTTGVSATASDVFGNECGTAATYNIPCDLPMQVFGSYKPSPFRNGLQYSFRGDQYMRDGKDRIYGSYLSMNRDDQNPAIRKSFSSVNGSNTWAVQANWTHTFRPSLLNEFSFGGNKVYGVNVTDAPFHVPDISVSGQGTGISPGWSGIFVQHNYNWRDVVSWVRGSHSLRLGGSYFRGDDWADFRNANGRPAYYFRNLLELVTDSPYSQSNVAYNPLTGQPAPFIFGGKVDGFNLFVQDEWRVRSNLMLTLGIRWDDFGNPDGIKGYTYSNMFLGSGGNLDTQVTAASVKSRQNPFDHRLNRNVSPRFGFAWSPGKSGKTTVRGGVGMYRDWVTLGETIDRLRGNPPGYLFPSFSIVTDIKPIFSMGTQDTYPFGFTLPSIPAGELNEAGGLVGVQTDVGGINPSISTPATVNWVIGVEHELPGRFVVGANYTGSHSWSSLGGTDYNRVAGDLLDGTLNRLNQNFGSMWYEDNINKINYNSMLLTVRKDIGARGMFQASYTLGKVTDYGQGGDRTTGFDNFDDQHDFYSRQGDAGWDVRQRFSFAGLYRLPTPYATNKFSATVLGGWELSATIISQTGTPFSVVNYAAFNPVLDSSGKVIGLQPGSGDYNADGYNFDYPNMPSTDFTGGHDRQQFLNGLFSSSDFPVPEIGTRGSFQRNAYRNPGYLGVNAGLIKNNPLRFIGEQGNLQLRFEFFNVLNRVNLGSVDANLSSGTFGKVTSARDPRIIQLGARIMF